MSDFTDDDVAAACEAAAAANPDRVTERVIRAALAAVAPAIAARERKRTLREAADDLEHADQYTDVPLSVVLEELRARAEQVSVDE